MRACTLMMMAKNGARFCICSVLLGALLAPLAGCKRIDDKPVDDLRVSSGDPARHSV